MNGKSIGDIGETRVLYEFTRLGIPVFLPYGENTKKDMIAEFNGTLNRIQVKTAGLAGDSGVYKVNLKNSSIRRDGATVVSIPTKDDIDFYGIYCLERDKPILIPISLVEGQGAVSIRFDDKYCSTSIYEKDFYFEKVIGNVDIGKVLRDNYVASTSRSVCKHPCVDCGKPVQPRSVRCPSCAAAHRAKVEKLGAENNISRSDLKNKIRTQSFLSIAKEFGVSDNAVRKWCDFYHLPRLKGEITKYSDEEWVKI